MQRKHGLLNRGFLTVKYLGKRQQLPASTKGSQISPRYAEVVVKQLDPGWARKGITTAPLKAGGDSADVAAKTEFVGDLPAHLFCWSDRLGRSDVTVAKVTAPSLRKLQVYSVSGSLGQHISPTQLAEQARAAQGHST